MIEIDSRDMDFLEDVFASIGEIEKDFEQFELLQDLQPSLGEGKDLNSCKFTEDGAPLLSNRNEGTLSAQRNEVHPNHQLLRTINLRMRFALNL